jgi:hypothetical protein
MAPISLGSAARAESILCEVSAVGLLGAIRELFLIALHLVSRINLARARAINYII